jgi:uncharacterized membrane protein
MISGPMPSPGRVTIRAGTGGNSPIRSTGLAEKRKGAPAGFPRGSEEFSRVLAFSDGMFAIAMTLLVVGIGVPTLTNGGDEGELLEAYSDLRGEVLSFFISFVVIGRYWIAHHRFFALLRAMDYTLVWINLLYLAFIAFLPFPTGVLGSYFDNPISVATYALAVALVSGLEVVLFRHAYRAGLLVREMPEEVYRWGALSSTLPVAFFVLSVPVAFLNTLAAVIVWFLAAPALALVDRRRPAEAADWF